MSMISAATSSIGFTDPAPPTGVLTYGVRLSSMGSSGLAATCEIEVLSSLTNESLLKALGELPTEQRECLIMRFLQGLSIAETAEILGRSSGAVKQLQLRGVRNLAKLIPAAERE